MLALFKYILERAKSRVQGLLFHCALVFSCVVWSNQELAVNEEKSDSTLNQKYKILFVNGSHGGQSKITLLKHYMDESPSLKLGTISIEQKKES